MRSETENNISELNQMLVKGNKIQTNINSRDLQFNKLNDKDSKAKSVPAQDRAANQDHITFGKCDYETGVEEDHEAVEFKKMLLKQTYSNNLSNEEDKIRTKSVVIPRSSIQLKNKKNLQKRNAEANNPKSMKDNSVSPTKIVFVPKCSNAEPENGVEFGDKGSRIVNSKHVDFKSLSRVKVNIKSNKDLVIDDSNLSLNDNLQRNKLKLVKNKVVPFKFIKNIKNPLDQSESYVSKRKYPCGDIN